MNNNLPKWGRLQEGHHHIIPAFSTWASTGTTPISMPTLTFFSTAQAVYDERPKKDCPICNPKPKEWTMLEWAQKQAEALFWKVLLPKVPSWYNDKTNTPITQKDQGWTAIHY